MVAFESTDRSLGFTVALSLVATAGALGMFLAPGTAVAGWGFAVAVIGAALAVVAAQAG